jgi:2-oxoglutarate dehydrogenase E1 component
MPEQPPSTFGPNAWLVDEMYDQYRVDPSSVSESWQEFFADYKREDPAPALNNNGPAGAAAPAANGAATNGAATNGAAAAWRSTGWSRTPASWGPTPSWPCASTRRRSASP